MHQNEKQWLRWGHDLKYQVWSRSLHGERFCIYAKYNTWRQANLFFLLFFSSLRTRTGRIVSRIFTFYGSKRALGQPLRPFGVENDELPNFPQFLPPKPQFLSPSHVFSMGNFSGPSERADRENVAFNSSNDAGSRALECRWVEM